jgi:protein tyrosine/serine phosphatase
MKNTDQAKNSVATSKSGFLKTGLAALLLLLTFGILSSNSKPSADPPEGAVTADDVTKEEAASAVKLTAPSDFPNIRIKNFGQMDEYFYRGAQPKPGDYETLAALGIKTIIDLRDDATSYEKPEAEAAGIRYVNIPMNDKKKPPEEQVSTFMALVDDPANRPFYVHCAGGRHRTGLVGAVYRYNKYGWDFDQVYQEMKNYDYYSRWGHGSIKDYVEEYYVRMKANKPFAPAADANEVKPPTQPITAPPPPKPKE